MFIYLIAQVKSMGSRLSNSAPPPAPTPPAKQQKKPPQQQPAAPNNADNNNSAAWKKPRYQYIYILIYMLTVKIRQYISHTVVTIYQRASIIGI